MSYAIKFEVPYGLTEDQARCVMEYMELYYRKQDVLNGIEDEDYFVNADDETKEEMLDDMAIRAQSLIEEGCEWRDAVYDAINYFKDEYTEYDEEEGE